MVRVNNLKDGRVDSSDLMCVEPQIAAKYKRTCLKGGEVLVSLVGTLGQVAVAPASAAGWNTARAVGVIPPAEGVEPEWLALALRAEEAQNFMDTRANTTVQATFNLGDLVEPKKENDRTI